MLFGVPLEIAVLLFIAGGWAIVIVGNGNPFYCLAVAPVWWAVSLLVRRDYNMVRIAILWLYTAGTAKDSRFWGGASVAPFPVRASAYGRGMLDAWR
jgi:type IV secretory pathway VirB3-like protein